MELQRTYIQRMDEGMVAIDLKTEQMLEILENVGDSESSTYFDTYVRHGLGKDDSKDVYMQFYIRNQSNDELISIITQYYVNES